jgi:hypothetical protein
VCEPGQQGGPNSTHRRATQLVKDSPEGLISVHMYRGERGGGGIESTRTPFLADSKLPLKIRFNDNIIGLINAINHTDNYWFILCCLKIDEF